MNPEQLSNYGVAQELLRLRTHNPALVAEAAKRLLATPVVQGDDPMGDMRNAIAERVQQGLPPFPVVQGVATPPLTELPTISDAPCYMDIDEACAWVSGYSAAVLALSRTPGAGNAD